MKKTFYALLFIGALFTGVPFLTQAAVYLPSNVSIGDQSSYEANTHVDIELTNNEKRPVVLDTNLEYGVAKAIKKGNLTYFEIITTDYQDLAANPDISRLTTVIPNILDTDATSSYVVYLKFFQKDNPESESFWFTKKLFSISPNTTPLTQVRNVNLLQSNGGRFFTMDGPSIYAPADIGTDKKLSTSTSIEITFESNIDTTVSPRISFSKLRSGTFSQEIALDPIAIKKGKTYKVIPLPTFDYEPGVYVGALTFEGGAIKNKVDFQYIVQGESVTIGSVRVVTEGAKNLFTFDVFGRPIDIYANDTTAPESTSTPLMYTVKTDFLDAKDEVVYTITQDVDFNKQDFSVEIPAEFTYIPKVHVTATSLTSGKVIFDAVKDTTFNIEVDNTAKIKKILFIVLYVILMLIGVFAIMKRYIKVAIFCMIVLIGMFAVRQAFANIFYDQYIYASTQTVFVTEGIGKIPNIFFQDAIASTLYACGQNVDVVFRVYHVRCTNSGSSIYAWMWWGGQGTGPAAGVDASPTVDYYVTSVSGHNFYHSLSSHIWLAVPTSGVPVATLYMQIHHYGGPSGFVTMGSTNYAIPIYTASCTVPVTPPVRPTPPDRARTCACDGTTWECTYADNGQKTREPRHSLCTLENTQDMYCYCDSNNGAKICKDSRTQQVITTGYGYPVCNPNSVSTNTTTTTTTPPPTPAILTFTTKNSVVRKGTSCEYNWTVTGVDRCTVTVNNVSASVIAPALTGPLLVATLNGNNQRANLTCVKDASGSTPSVTVSTSTTCSVLPEVIER